MSLKSLGYNGASSFAGVPSFVLALANGSKRPAYARDVAVSHTYSPIDL